MYLLIVSAPVIRLATYAYSGNDWSAYVWMPARTDALAVGALIAMAWMQNRLAGIDARNVGYAFVALLAFCIVIGPATGSAVVLGHSALAFLSGSALLYVLKCADAPCLAILRSQLAAHVARISYTLYLVHGGVLVAVFWIADTPRLLNDWYSAVLVFTALALSLSISTMSYYLMERYAIAFGHRPLIWRGRIKPAAEPKSARVQTLSTVSIRSNFERAAGARRSRRSPYRS